MLNPINRALVGFVFYTVIFGLTVNLNATSSTSANYAITTHTEVDPVLRPGLREVKL